MLYIFGPNEKLQAVLKNDGKTCPYWNPIHREVLNGENIFQFTVPADHPDSQYVTEGNMVAFRDLDQDWQLFEIKRTVDEHTDSLIRTAHCEHALYELCDDFIEDRRPTDVSAHFALTQALSGTRWSVGTVDDLGLNSTNYYYESALSAVQKVAAAWSGELRFRVVVSGGIISARYVDLLVRRGADTGKMFEYGRHTQEIQREVDLTTTVTALYGRGKGVEIEETGGYGRRLTFADIEWSIANGDPVDKPLGQEWVGDPDALAQWGRPSNRHRFNIFDDSEETDPVVLLQKTWASLQERKNPRATYTMKVLDLERVSGYAHEKVRLGDTVRCIDRKVSPPMFLAARVIEISRNITDPSDTEVILGNFAPTLADAAKTQQQINQTVRDRQGIWDSGGTPFVGPVPTDWLDGIIDVLTNQLKSTTSNWYTDENGNLVFETLDGTAAMRLTGNGFMLANEKNPVNDEWVWRTFGTGDGFTADEIKSGEIQTSLVKILGNTNFYWDGDYLYITNPDELNQQIRLSKEGIRFTRNGGQTWGVAMDFDGLRMEGKSQDGHTIYTGDGTKVYDKNDNLVGHLGSFESLGSSVATFSRTSTAYKQDGTQVTSGQPRFESSGVMIEEGTTNLLASDGNFEIDSNGDGVPDGWAFYSAPTYQSIATDRKWSGSKSIKIICNNTGGGSQLTPAGQSTLRNATAGQTYTASCKIWIDGSAFVGSPMAFLYIRFTDDSGNTINQAAVTADMTKRNQWQTISVTLTAGTGATKVRVLLPYVNVPAGSRITCWYDAVQIEQKIYRTTYCDNNRLTETLSVPTSGILNAAQGSIECRIFLDALKTLSTLPYQAIFCSGASAPGPRLLIMFDATQSGKISVWDGDGSTEQSLSSSITPSAGSEHYITFTWSADGRFLYIDGQQVGFLARTGPIGFTSSAYIGTWGANTGTNLNGIISDIRISNRARTLEEHQTYIASGPQVDDATTLMMTLNGTLLPTVRDYGLFAKNGRIILQNPAKGQGVELWDGSQQKVVIGRLDDGSIGQIIRGGKLYSSEVRTGAEGANSYIGLLPNNALSVVYNGNKVLETLANSSQGHLKFYEAGAQKGKISASGNTFYVDAEDESGTHKRLYLRGSNIEIRSSGTLDLYPGYEVTVQGDFFTTGTLTAGDKRCTEKTSQGVVGLHTRESPDIRYIDEGRAELLSGQCIIELDPLFLECVEPDNNQTPWYIHLTPIGAFTPYIVEVCSTEGYIAVASKELGANGKFNWSLSGVRKGKAGDRFPRMEWLVGGDEENDPVLTTNWEDDLLSGVD